MKFFSSPGRKFDVVVMDPPWENKHVKRVKGYSMMSNEHVKSLPLPKLVCTVYNANVTVETWKPISFDSCLSIKFLSDVGLGAVVRLVHGVEAAPRGRDGVDARLGVGAGGRVDLAEGDPIRRAGRRSGQGPQAALRISVRGEDAGLQIAG